jgi:hypothetical protein
MKKSTKKLTNSQLRSRKKMRLLINRDKIKIETSFLKLSRFSQPSRLTFCQCQGRESHLRQIETPRLTI